MSDEGGPAFGPIESYKINDGDQPAFGPFLEIYKMGVPFSSMSLRDWFAGQTLSDCLFNARPADIARNAYAIADAMIAARGKR